ncbi:MAG: Glutamate racemase [Turneriella sp.]|nr:Glutamate racemase [Turneriella sp.]
MPTEKTEAHKSIGVFDSGLGGLTVLKEIHRVLPQENLVYFGDTARVPYGNKSSATIIRYSKEIAEFLIQRDVKAIVVACNTASSYALDALKQMTSIPVLGVIDPAVGALAQRAKKQSAAGLIATKSTIHSGAYDAALKRHHGEQFLVSRACPLLVPVIEEGFIDSPITEEILRIYLQPMVDEGIEYLLLGCTHYPLIARVIVRLYPHLKLIDSAEETAATLKNLLTQMQLLNTAPQGRIELYVSDMTESMRELKELFFQNSVDRFEVVKITND